MANAKAIIAKYGDREPDERQAVYAAKVCANLSCGCYRDWFLPSLGDLELMYKNLAMHGIGAFSSALYWSSSEDRTVSDLCAVTFNFSNGKQDETSKDGRTKVLRPVRAF